MSGVRVPVAIFKHSKLATVCSFIGTAVLLIGLYIVIPAIFEGGFHFTMLLWFVVAAALLFGAVMLNKAAIKRMVKKALKEPGLDRKVRYSAQKAYFLYQQTPHKLVLEFILQHNAQAGRIIIQRKLGVLSEEEATRQLRELDRLQTTVISDTAPAAWVKARGTAPAPVVVTDEDRERFHQEAQDAVKVGIARRITELQGTTKKRKRSILIFTGMFVVALVGLIVCSACQEVGTVTLEPKDASLAHVGDYVSLEVSDFNLNPPYKEEDGYCYYSWTEIGFRAENSGLSQYSYDFRIPQESTEWFRVLLKTQNNVTIYGRVIEVDGQSVLDGRLEPQTTQKSFWPAPWTGLATLLAVVSGICLVVFGSKYFRENKELKKLQLNRLA